MTRPPLLAELTQGLEHWHTALARGDGHARTAAGLLVDILVAGGLDERLEEVLTPNRRPAPQARAEQQSLAILRQANALAGALQELAASNVAIWRELERRRNRLEASPPPRAPDRKSADAPLRRFRPRRHHAALLCLVGAIALLAFTLGHVTAPLPTPLPGSYLIEPPSPMAPLR